MATKIRSVKQVDKAIDSIKDKIAKLKTQIDGLTAVLKDLNEEKKAAAVAEKAKAAEKAAKAKAKAAAADKAKAAKAKPAKAKAAKADADA